jgi:lipid-A-disaccharide synthase
MNGVLIVAGEASADHHAAKVVRALAERGIASYGMGGDRMIAAGFEAVAHAHEISVMGLVEVLRHLPRILGVMERMRQVVRERKPKVALLLDLPDFNLRFARFLAQQGVYVIYYISPQVWAWRQKRVRQIREVVGEMLCVLPFEPEFYAEHRVNARFIGHPLTEDLRERPTAEALRRVLPSGRVVALLPGSRRQESHRLLPAMLGAAAQIHAAYPDASFVMPLAGTTVQSEVEHALAGYPQLRERMHLVIGQAQDALAVAQVAVVASGTATLEAALIGVPFIAVYRMSPITYWLAQRIVKAAAVLRVTSIVLANLILGERRIGELLQGQASADNIAVFLRRGLEEPALTQAALETREALLQALGSGSATSGVVAAVEKALQT